MKHLRLPIPVALLGLSGFAIFGSASAQIAASSTPTPLISSEAFHITSADGEKSIAQLIREQSVGTPTPNRPIKSFHFIVDSMNDALILARNPAAHPAGFQLAVAPGDEIKFDVSKLPINAPEALEQFPVRTDGICNFLMFIELYLK